MVFDVHVIRPCLDGVYPLYCTIQCFPVSYCTAFVFFQVVRQFRTWPPVPRRLANNPNLRLILSTLPPLPSLLPACTLRRRSGTNSNTSPPPPSSKYSFPTNHCSSKPSRTANRKSPNSRRRTRVRERERGRPTNQKTLNHTRTERLTLIDRLGQRRACTRVRTHTVRK